MTHRAGSGAATKRAILQVTAVLPVGIPGPGLRLCGYVAMEESGGRVELRGVLSPDRVQVLQHRDPPVGRAAPGTSSQTASQ